MSDADRVIIRPACLRDLSWVAAFMRQVDRDEVFALMADDNPLALAARLDLVTEQSWCAHWRGRAVAAFHRLIEVDDDRKIVFFCSQIFPKVSPSHPP